MKSKVLTFFKYALPLGLAILLLAFLFRKISFAEVIEKFRTADYRWAILSGIILLLAHVSRAYRWKLLLQPLGYKPSLKNTFLAVMTGYFANLLLPRMGEVTRCGVLQRMEGVPVNAGFGTVVAERLCDLVSLAILFFLTFLLEFDRLSSFFMELFASKTAGSDNNSGSSVYLIVAAIVLIGLTLLVIVYRSRRWFGNNALYTKVRNFIKGMVDGLLSVRKLERKWDFVLQSALIWLGYYLASYLLTFALTDMPSLSPLAGLTILIMGSLGMAAPVQGGTGPFHAMVSSALVLYGWKSEAGLILATFIWASQTLLTMVAGGIAFLISLFIVKPTSTEEVVVKTV